jgi:hypothetical protein
VAYQLSYLPIFTYFSGLDLIVDCLFAIGVKRFVYISSADFGLANYLLQGYYEGKVLFHYLLSNHVTLMRMSGMAHLHLLFSGNKDCFLKL